MLNIEQILSDRYPQLQQGPNRLLARPLFGLFRLLFHEREINLFLQQHRELDGAGFLEQVLEHFGFGYTVSNRDRRNIPASGRVVIVANHPLGALDAFFREKPDVAVVSMELRGRDGLFLCKEVRRFYPTLPLVLISSGASLREIYKAFTANVSHFMKKPVDTDELVFSLLQLTKRKNGIFRLAENLYMKQGHAYHGETVIPLTNMELSVLQEIVAHHPNVVTHYHFFDRFGLSETAMRNHIYHLRHKLGQELIVTVRGIGYKLSDLADADHDE